MNALIRSLFVLLALTVGANAYANEPAKRSYLQAKAQLEEGQPQKALTSLDAAERALGGTNLRIEALRIEVLTLLKYDVGVLRSAKIIRQLTPPGEGMQFSARVNTLARKASDRLENQDREWAKVLESMRRARQFATETESVQAADRLRGFYERYPFHPRSSEARTLEASFRAMAAELRLKFEERQAFERISSKYESAISTTTWVQGVEEAIFAHREFLSTYGGLTHDAEARRQLEALETHLPTVRRNSNENYFQGNMERVAESQAMASAAYTKAIGYVGLGTLLAATSLAFWIGQPIDSDIPVNGILGGMALGSGIFVFSFLVPDAWSQATRLSKDAERTTAEAYSRLPGGMPTDHEFSSATTFGVMTDVSMGVERTSLFEGRSPVSLGVMGVWNALEWLHPNFGISLEPARFDQVTLRTGLAATLGVATARIEARRELLLFTDWGWLAGLGLRFELGNSAFYLHMGADYGDWFRSERASSITGRMGVGYGF